MNELEQLLEVDGRSSYDWLKEESNTEEDKIANECKTLAAFLYTDEDKVDFDTPVESKLLRNRIMDENVMIPGNNTLVLSQIIDGNEMVSQTGSIQQSQIIPVTENIHKDESVQNLTKLQTDDQAAEENSPGKSNLFNNSFDQIKTKSEIEKLEISSDDSETLLQEAEGQANDYLANDKNWL